MNNRCIIVLFATISLFVSCEYDPAGNNFVELNPPEEDIQIAISLNEVNPSDTIYLYQNTSFSIQAYPQNDLKETTVLLDDKEYVRFSGNPLSFAMSPD